MWNGGLNFVTFGLALFIKNVFHIIASLVFILYGSIIVCIKNFFVFDYGTGFLQELGTGFSDALTSFPVSQRS